MKLLLVLYDCMTTEDALFFSDQIIRSFSSCLLYMIYTDSWQQRLGVNSLHLVNRASWSIIKHVSVYLLT